MSAQPHTLFISYAHENEAFVNRFRADLTRNHIAHWVDKVGLKWGTPDWEEAIRNALAQASLVLYIASPDARKSDYVRDEIKIARELLGKPVHAVWAAGEHWLDCVPLGFGTQQYADLRGDAYEQGLQEVLAILTANSNSNSASTTMPQSDAPIHNPYIGLRAFERDDRADFFGRDVFIARLIESMVTQPPNQRLLGIVGPSGSGKSSVVMAGLLPQLMDGAVPAQGLTKSSAAWHYLDPIKPGTQPIENLAIALKRELPDSISAIREDLDHRACRGLHQLAKRLVRPGERLVLFIDQFEEAFTNLTTSNEAERVQFIHLLTTAAAEPDGMVQIILTLRADFYDRPMKYAELNHLLDARGQSVPTMSVSDLIDAVNKPAARAGLHFEDGLMGDIVFSVRDRIGALPLLQFALEQLAEDAVRRHTRSLSRAAYAQMGGVQGALARHAQRQFEKPQLPNDEVLGQAEKARLAHALFRRLVLPGNTEQDVARRRAPLSELSLTDPEDTRKLRALAEAFVRARLLTVSAEPEQAEPDYEVSHEALLREWPWLSDWIAQNRADIALHHALSDDVRGWRAHPRDGSYLYSGGRLLALNAFAALHHDEMTPDELTFWAASQKHEARLRGMRRSLVFLPVLLAVALAMAGLAGWAMYQGRQAEMARQEAHLISQAVRANVLRDADPLVGMALAVDALALAPQSAGVFAVAVQDANSVLPMGRVLRLPGHVSYFGLNHDSTIALVKYNNKPGELREAASGNLLVTLSSIVGGWTFSPDGKTLVVDYSNKPSEVRETATWKVLATLSGVRQYMSFSADGRILVVFYSDQLGELRQTATGEVMATFNDPVKEWDFSPDGTLLTVDYLNKPSEVRDTATGRVLATFSGEVSQSNFSADSKMLVVHYSHKRSEVLDATTGKVLATLSGDAERWYFSTDGKILAVDYRYQPGEVRETKTWKVLTTFSDAVEDWNFSVDQKTLVVEYSDLPGEIRETATGTVLATLSGPVDFAGFSADDQILVVNYWGKPGEVRDTATWKVRATLSGTINGWSFNADGMTLVVNYNDQPSEVRETKTWKVLAILSGAVERSYFSTDGKILVVDYRYQPGEVRETKTWKVLATLSGLVSRWNFGENRKTLVTQYVSDATEVWDMKGFAQMTSLGYGMNTDITGHSVALFDASEQTLWGTYVDGRTFVFDLIWLRAIRGGAALPNMTSQQIVETACRGPLSGPFFDVATQQRVVAELGRPFTACNGITPPPTPTPQR